MHPARERAVEGATAVRVHVGGLARGLGQEIRLVLARLERTSRDERCLLVEHAPVARRPHVIRGDVRQPHEIVREVRAGAAAARGVPPVEHVALDELMRSVEDDLGTREVGPGVDQRGGVLELVAKAERAARLIERRPPPQAAGERLVEEPAVRHEVEGAARCLHLDRGQRRLPEGAHLIQSLVERSRLPIARDERPGRAGIGRLTEKERAFDAGVRRDRELDLQRGTRVEPGAGPAVEPGAAGNARGVVERAIGTEERGAVSRESNGGLRHGRREDDAVGEVAAGGIPREERAGCSVELRDDRRRRDVAEDELGVPEDRQPARVRTGVPQAHPDDLHRIVSGNEEADLLLEVAALVPPARVAEAVPHLERRERRDRARQRRPEDAGLLVTHVERLAVRIDDRVVRPRRQAVQPAVPAPRRAGARLAHEEAECLVRNDVDPRHRRPLGADPDDVLAAVGREAAVADVEGEGLRFPISGRARGRRDERAGHRRPAVADRRAQRGRVDREPLGTPVLFGPREVVGTRHRTPAENRRAERPEALRVHFREPEAVEQCALPGLRAGEHRVGVARGERDGGLARVGGAEQRDETYGLARRERDRASEAQHRVEHAADGPRERDARNQREWACGTPSAAEKARAIGLALERPLAGKRVHHPRRPLALAPRAATRQEHAVAGDRRLDEELRERRMRRVGGGIVQHDLGIGRDVDAPGARRSVDEHDRADLDVGFGRDRRVDP